MVKRKDFSKLEHPPITAYVSIELQKWLREHADYVAKHEGQPIKVAGIIRRALVQYRQKHENEV